MLCANNVSNCEHGVTNNLGESINATLKPMRESKITMEIAIVKMKVYLDHKDWKVFNTSHGKKPYRIKKKYKNVIPIKPLSALTS